MYRVIILWLCIIHFSSCKDSYTPEQVHISFGETVNDVVVTWNTMNDTEESIVEYGIGDLTLTATGSSTKFTNEGSEKRIEFIHRVTLPNLTPGNKYTYHCGSSKGWSDEIWFKTLPTDPDWIYNFAIYGDLGLVNGVSTPPLETETQQGMYDAIFHIGDFAYDMSQNNGVVGDDFMNRIQSIAAYVPYMTCVGNHEEPGNFSDYRARFTMPGNTEGLWYSINIGPAHLIFISTEVYYYTQYGLELITKQYEWLEQDLKEATSAENRAKHPWIIIMGHRPMYCTNTDGDDCTYHDTLTRVGLSSLNCCGLEKLLYDYGVDLALWAHEHSYERLLPMYDYKVMNGSVEEPYHNPRATVHITTGAAGCQELHDHFIASPPEWSAYRSSEYGYMRMQIHNATHLYMEQTAVKEENEDMDVLGKDGVTNLEHPEQAQYQILEANDDDYVINKIQDNKVIDSIWLIRETHGPFGEE